MLCILLNLFLELFGRAIVEGTPLPFKPRPCPEDLSPGVNFEAFGVPLDYLDGTLVDTFIVLPSLRFP